MRNENFINRQLQEKLHRVACRLLKDDMDAEDAVQDAICNLWSNRVPRSFVELSECNESSDAVGFDDSERLKSLMLASLSPLQRKIFQMAAFEDIEYEDIAERLHMSVAAVRMNMSRARKKMRELYKKM